MNDSERMFDQAKKAFDSQWKLQIYGANGVAITNLDLIYLWSLRVYHAQQAEGVNDRTRASAPADHLQRMTDLEKLVNDVINSGSSNLTVADAEAAKFYKIEAELLAKRVH